MRPQPLIVVKDVAASSRFYERLLGCKSTHGPNAASGEWEYDRLVDPTLHHTQWDSDGLILQLHAWDIEHHHGPMGDPGKPIGNGMLLWFEIDDFDAAVARARELGAKVLMEPHVNPAPDHRDVDPGSRRLHHRDRLARSRGERNQEVTPSLSAR